MEACSFGPSTKKTPAVKRGYVSLLDPKGWVQAEDDDEKSYEESRLMDRTVQRRDAVAQSGLSDRQV